MNDLLKILPLMNMPEPVRQPLLLDALSGRGNAMVGYLATRQAAAAGAGLSDPAQARNDAEAILAHLYRRHGTSDREWAARLSGLRATIEASNSDDDKQHFRAFEAASDDAYSDFLLQVLAMDDAIDPAIVQDFQAISKELQRLVNLLADRHRTGVSGINVPATRIEIEFQLSPIRRTAAATGRPPTGGASKVPRKTTGAARPLPGRK